MQEALSNQQSQSFNRGIIMECPCGAEYAPRFKPCDHRGEPERTRRFRAPSGRDGIRIYVLGPEGNEIPLFCEIFEEEYIQEGWFDSEGRAHLGIKRPYKDVAEYTVEDFD